MAAELNALGWASGTGSGFGSVRGPPSCTSRSWACSWRGRPTCRSTPTTRTSGPARLRGGGGRGGHRRRPRDHCGPGRLAAARSRPRTPSLGDDAWIIFTSGSTGVPKGVAVSHRSAAGFVDAESRLFLQNRPIGLGDRVMAGLSVAFDASCEEMWLAWRYGACLVPAPRSLVRSGMDLGPWLVANEITVVSTVPTLVALWPPDALAKVRLLILGGEACPPEIGAAAGVDRAGGLEHLRTHRGDRGGVRGPAGRRATGPHRPAPGRLGPRRGRREGGHVAPGETGELIIGGIGLARYLDPDKDAEKYAPMPSLGWERAYRSGDLVRYDEAGLVFGGTGRRPGQGGRSADRARRDRQRPALPSRRHRGGGRRPPHRVGQHHAGRLRRRRRAASTSSASLAALRDRLPAPLVPRLAEVDALPTRTSGKIDRDALPWPVPTLGATRAEPLQLSGTAAWLQELWLEILGAVVTDLSDDFFDVGGGSLDGGPPRLPAARAVPRGDRGRHLRAAHAGRTWPRLSTRWRAPAATLEPQRAARAAARPRSARSRSPIPLRTLTGLRWVTWVAAGNNARGRPGSAWPGCRRAPWWAIAIGWLVLITPARAHAGHGAGGPAAAARGSARGSIRAVGRCICASGPPSGWPTRWARPTSPARPGCASTPARSGPRSAGMSTCTRSLRSPGMLTLGDECSIEPEVDLSGHWLDGDILHLGHMAVGEARPRRGPEHALPGRLGRGARRARARFGRLRRGAGRRVVGRRPGSRTGRARGPVGRRPAAEPPEVAGGVCRDGRR